MKVYVIPISPRFQPPPMRAVYPPHNEKDYGIEQDFHECLEQNSIVVGCPVASDWHYLPVYWTRYHVAHNYGTTGREVLQQEVTRRILNPAKTFTICQYDDGLLVNPGEIVQFLGSRKGQKDIDVPLMSYAHQTPAIIPPKRWLASFAGRLNTHPIRSEMQCLLCERDDIDIQIRSYQQSFQNGNKGVRFFTDQILQSYIALCPRGYGNSTFRFYEAMQLGVVPLLIGSSDVRPFKAFLDWDEVSLYAKTVEDIESILDSHSTDELLQMGKAAKAVWYNDLAFGKWCRYAIKTLETLR